MTTSEPRAAGKSVQLRTFDNAWYYPGGSLRRTLWFLVNGLFFNHPFALFTGLKVALLRLFGARVGDGAVIKPSVNIKYPWKLSIGHHCWIGENVWIDNLGPVLIGNNVCLSQGAMLVTGNHDFTKTTFDLMVAPITLEDGVWIGARAVVCPGVYCESHSVLTVQSVATGRMLGFTVYQGNPAAPIRQRRLTG